MTTSRHLLDSIPNAENTTSYPEIAANFADTSFNSTILVELENTANAQGDRVQIIGRNSPAQTYFTTAQTCYQQTLEQEPEGIDAALNLLGLWIETGQLDAANQLLSTVPPHLTSLPWVLP